MAAPTAAQYIAALADAFDRARWRDSDGTVLQLARALTEGTGPAKAAEGVSSRFLATNETTRAQVLSVVEAAVSTVGARAQSPKPNAADELNTAPIDPAGQPHSPAGRPPAQDQPPAHGADTISTGAPPVTTLRIAVGAIILVAGPLLVAFEPDLLGWSWLLDHPNRIAIQALAALATVFIGLGLLFRRWQVIGLGMATVIAMLAIVGGAPPANQ